MHVEGHIESGSGYSSGGGTSSGPRRTNRTPIGSAGTDMGSGMMGNPTMGGNMMGGMTNGLMSGVSFMSEPLGGGSGGTTPRRTNRTPIGSAGTDMGSGTSSFGSYGDLTGAVESMGIRSPNVNKETDTFASKLVNRSLSRLSEPAKPSSIFSMNGEPVINVQKNTNSFYLLFPELSSEIIETVKNQQFVSNMSNGYNIPIQSQIQSTYTQNQMSTPQEFIIPMNKFSDTNIQSISEQIIYETNISINTFSEVFPQISSEQIIYSIQTKPIPLTKLL